MQSPTQKPDFLYEAQLGFYTYCALNAAMTHSIFEHLQQPTPFQEVARHLRKDPLPVLKLLEALSAMGLVRRDGDAFRNTGIAEAYCLSSSPCYQGTLFSFTHDTFGRPFFDQSKTLSVLHGDQTTIFDEVALSVAASVGFALPATIQETMELIRALDCFDTATSFLDLGGGPGLFGMAAADLKDDLEVTVFDRPSVIPHSKKTARHFGKAHRIHFAKGDMHNDHLGGPYDIIFMSDCISMSIADLPARLERIRSFLTHGGAIVLRHNETTHDEKTPKLNALLNLGAALTGHGDYMFTQGVIPDALRQAGFSRIQSTPQQHITHHYMVHIGRNDEALHFKACRKRNA